ncbi:hypothetical protein SDC9_155969 [bioreactor metagenome]|uniref:Uncharacterized protein n=1 Tax=bioreactor metagenome TaxID=1076179 RepID=A0A645F7W6_9ZZZZ
MNIFPVSGMFIIIGICSEHISISLKRHPVNRSTPLHDFFNGSAVRNKIDPYFHPVFMTVADQFPQIVRGTGTTVYLIKIARSIPMSGRILNRHDMERGESEFRCARNQITCSQQPLIGTEARVKFINSDSENPRWTVLRRHDTGFSEPFRHCPFHGFIKITVRNET